MNKHIDKYRIPYDTKVVEVYRAGVSRGFFHDLFQPEFTLVEVYIEDEDGRFSVVLIADRHGAFRTKRVKKYVEGCFPGGDPYTWTTDEIEEAFIMAEKYKERIGHRGHL